MTSTKEGARLDKYKNFASEIKKTLRQKHIPI